MNQLSDQSSNLKVFISYSRQDMDFAREIKAGLEMFGGFDVTIDTEQIHEGEEWQERISELVAAADAVAFILTPSSAGSPICQWEVEEAERLCKRILPVQASQLGDIKPPKQLSILHYVRFDNHDDGRPRSFVESLGALRHALSTDIVWLREHTRLLIRAREWIAANRAPNRLLSGDDVDAAKAWLACRPSDAPAPNELHHDFISASEVAESKKIREERSRNESLRKAVTQARFAFIAVSLVALVAFALGWIAYQQREDAIRQSTNVKLERDRAKDAEQVAKNERDNTLLALRTQSRLLAKRSQELSSKSDFVSAALLTLEALPDKESTNPVRRSWPYVPSVEKILFMARAKLREHAIIDEASHSVLFSPDNRLVATISGKLLLIWEANTGKLVRTIVGHTDIIREAAFSADGHRIATVSDDKSARVWNATSGKELIILRGHDHVVSSVAFDPQHHRILTSSWDKTARIWDAKTGKEIRTLEHYKSTPIKPEFSPDGLSVLAVSGSNARLLSVSDGKELASFAGHTAKLNSIAFSPDGKIIATASSDKLAILWNASSGDRIATLRGHTDLIKTIVFSPDGRRILTAAWDKTARIWDTTTGKELDVLDGHQSGVSNAIFSPDGLKVLTLGARARLWSSETGSEIARFNYFCEETVNWGCGVRAAAFSPDGRMIATSSYDGKTRIWRVKASGTEMKIFKGHSNDVVNAVYSRNDELVFTMAWDLTARIWDVASGTEISSLNELCGKFVFWAGGSPSCQVKRAKFAPDNEKIVTSGASLYDARIWKVSEGTKFATLKGHTSVVTDIDLSRDGRFIIISYDDMTARLWNFETAGMIAVLRGHTSEVTHAVFSPNGLRAVTASKDKTARVWEVPSGRSIAVLKGHTSAVIRSEFSPDNRRILTSSRDNTLRLWAADTGKPLKVLQGHDNSVDGAMFSPDGKRIVSFQAFDNKARVWNSATGRLIAVLNGHDRYGSINSAVFSPNGLRVLTSSDDGTVRFWTAATGADVGSIKAHDGHENDVLSAVYNSNGTAILTASRDNMARIWRVFSTTQSLINHVKQTVPRCLTLKQRKDFFLDAEPPRWCITGTDQEHQTDPKYWRPKWPYHTMAWKKWLVARDRGEKLPLPN